MNYPNKQIESNQEVILRNRENLKVTGVKKLDSLNCNEFIMETSLGKMIVKGQNLEMQQLDIESGILLITGNVYLIEYSNHPKTQEKQKSFVSKLFK